MEAIDDRRPPPPCPDPFNLADHVLAPGLTHPDKIALSVISLSGAERWSHGRLRAACLGLAAELSSRVPKGGRVLLRLGNTVEFPVAFLAAAAADLVPVPVSAQLTAAELADISAQIQPALILHDPELPLHSCDTPVMPRSELADCFDRPALDPVLGSPERPGYIVFTSGTSGRPRAVLHAHRAIWARRMMHDGWYGLRESDRLMHSGAFNWTYTLGTGLLDPWSAGATALIPAKGVTAAQIPLLLKRHDATILASVPGIYRQILNAAPLPALPRLRHGFSAGETLSPSLRDKWRAATGTDVHEAFGMSECSTFVSGAPDRPAPRGGLGYAQPGRRVAIVDAQGEVQPRNTQGIIAVDRRDPGLCLGYVGHRDEFEARLAGEWFLTGDEAQMDDEGAVIYLGRADDMMNAGGFRLSPIEAETALLAHPAISEAAVLEIQVKPEVSVIGAFIVTRAALDDTAISAHMSERLARYKHPRIYLRLDSLPRNANGKLNRRALREIYEARHGQA